MEPWIIPGERYYYGWYSPHGPLRRRTDAQIKSEIVDRLRRNRFTAGHQIRVDVKEAVVILQGEVATRLAKRAAGDDCWDTDGVADVSNQLTCDVTGSDGERDIRVRDEMTPDPVVAPSTATIRDVATLMADNKVKSIVVVDEERHPTSIVTEADLVVRALAVGLPVSTPVSEVTTSEIITIEADATPEQAIATLVDAAVWQLPVTDEGRLVGIVSLGDFARYRDPGSALARISSARRSKPRPQP